MPMKGDIVPSDVIVTKFNNPLELAHYIEDTWVRCAKIGSEVLPPRYLVQQNAATEISITNLFWEVLQELKCYRARILFMERPNGAMTRTYIIFKYPKTSNWMCGQWTENGTFPLYGPFSTFEDTVNYFHKEYKREAGDVKVRLSRETRDTFGHSLIEDPMSIETWLKIARSWKRYKNIHEEVTV